MAKEIKPPRLKISRRIKKDKVFKVKVKFNHPSFTGLAIADDSSDPVFNRVMPVTFVRNMLVYYGEELVSRLRISSGISDEPLFVFKFKASKEDKLKVVFVDNFGKKWEASKKVKFKKS